MKGYNPISTVDGIGIPIPSSYQYDHEDISKSNAGRTENIEMHKNRIGRVVAITLSWEMVSIPDCSKILQAFEPEYVTVKYLDALAGGFVTHEFYVGTVSAPLFNTSNGKWESLSFKLTTRKNAL